MEPFGLSLSAYCKPKTPLPNSLPKTTLSDIFYQSFRFPAYILLLFFPLPALSQEGEAAVKVQFLNPNGGDLGRFEAVCMEKTPCEFELLGRLTRFIPKDNGVIVKVYGINSPTFDKAYQDSIFVNYDICHFSLMVIEGDVQVFEISAGVTSAEYSCQ